MAGSPVNERILLNCWILGYSQLEDIFSINVQPSDDLTDLKQKIKTVNHPIFNGVGIAQLRVYKLLKPISAADAANKLGGTVDAATIPGSESLLPLATTPTIFNRLRGIAEKDNSCIHLVVQILPPDRNKRTLDQALGSAPEEPKRRKLMLIYDSETIYKVEPDSGTASQPPSPTLLPPCGAGFKQLTTFPNVIAADKTKYIAELDRKSSYQYLFLRPRRFGKSTFLQMLSEYYDKTLGKDFAKTFGCLHIGKNRTNDASSLLVLCFDLSRIAVSSYQEAKDSFHRIINAVLRKFIMKNKQYLSHYDEDRLIDKADAGLSLSNVLDHVQTSGQRLFVGVDEYDAPLNRVLSLKPNELYKQLSDFLSSDFFGVLKKAVSDTIVIKYWLTGVLPAYRDGISPLSATRNLSKTRQFHGLCGLTDAEVRTIVTQYLSSSPKLQSHYIEAVMDELRLWHNGHRFAEDAETLYNPQLVFAHLEGLAEGNSTRPDDELEAVHTSSILKSIDESTFREVFLLAASAKLESVTIKHHFTVEQMCAPDAGGWLTQTLLYFFGVFTYDEDTTFLKVPNKTMQTVINIHFSHLVNGAAAPFPNLANAALSGLSIGDVEPVIQLVETFFGDMPVRAVQYANENSLRTLMDALWFHNPVHHCISELRLVAYPNVVGAGRCKFADIFLPGVGESVVIPCLELKHATLSALWRGMGDGTEGDELKFQNLRDNLRNMGKEELLALKVKYQHSHNRADTSIKKMLQDGTEQVREYLRLIRNGASEGQKRGVEDHRIKCEPGESTLFGYVVVCIGTTRVLARKVASESGRSLFKVTHRNHK